MPPEVTQKTSRCESISVADSKRLVQTQIMSNAARTALLVLSLALCFSSAALAQDAAKPGKGKAAEKAPKKDEAKAPAPDVTYLDLSGPSEPESDLPAITKKGAL